MDTGTLILNDVCLNMDMYDEIEMRAGIGSWLLCLSTDEIHFSNNFYRLLGLTKEDGISTLSDIAKCLHPEDRPKLRNTEKAMYDERYIPEYEYRVTDGQQIVKFVKQSGEVYTDGQGNKYLKGYVQEIMGYVPKEHHTSDNFEYLRRLKEKLSFYEMIVDSSIDRTMVFDMENRIISWNKRSEIVTGISKAEITGKDIFEVFPKMKGCTAVVRAIKNAMQGFNVYVPAEKSRYETGYYENHYIPLKDENEEVFAVLNIKHDVAHRIKAENELKALNKSLAKKNKELKRRNSELRSFSHVTSHDLKEPLRKIYMFIEMFLAKEQGNFSETGKMYFKKIQASVQRMGLLTDDILAFCQLDTENNRISEVDLNNIFVFAKNHQRELIDAKQAIVEAEKMPVFNGYRPMLTQLFQSIINNALKFQHKGVQPYIKISAAYINGSDVKHLDAIPDTKYLKLSFTDNGIGFEKKYAERIFEMFMRLNSADNYQGSGIGLAICKKIAEMHHGFITAESEPGKGSTFHCYLQVNLK